MIFHKMNITIKIIIQFIICCNSLNKLTFLIVHKKTASNLEAVFLWFYFSLFAIRYKNRAISTKANIDTSGPKMT